MKKGDFIKVNYIGRLESGEIFDLTDEETAKKEKVYNEKIRYGPVVVVIGEGFLVKGLEKVLEEMEVGEKKTVSVHPEEGFGTRNPELNKIVNEKEFEKQNMKPRQGMIVDFGEFKGRIQSVSAGRVTIDFNHPLAGKVLKYEIEVTEKIEDDEKKIKSVIDFFGDPSANVSFHGKTARLIAQLPVQLRKRTADIILKHLPVDAVEFVEIYKKEK